MKQEYIKAYNKGKELAGNDYNTIVYNNLAPDDYFFDFTL